MHWNNKAVFLYPYHVPLRAFVNNPFRVLAFVSYKHLIHTLILCIFPITINVEGHKLQNFLLILLLPLQAN